MKHPIYRTLLILLLITTVAIGAIAYGKGYRISKDETGKNIVAGTGLLVMTSVPDGARAFVDNELVTATDSTLNLKPGSHTVRIEKDGYFPWKKIVEITNERVTETNALLFPKAPQLESLTITGVSNPTIGNEGDIIAYTVSSASADLNGIYIMSLNRGFIPIGNSKKQIASNLIDTFSDASLEISPDGSELLATIISKSTGMGRVYTLKTGEFNSSPLLTTSSVSSIREGWIIDEKTILNEKIRPLPKTTQKLILKHFTEPEFSPKRDKILYVASISAQLPLVINPKIPSTNSTPETRDITQGDLYVYNIKDDRNYLIDAQSESPFPEFIWHPDGRHLYYINGNRINSIEYDGHNDTTIYAGLFLNNFITPWQDGSGIVILTSFNDPGIPPNLYRINLK